MKAKSERRQYARLSPRFLAGCRKYALSRLNAGRKEDALSGGLLFETQKKRRIGDVLRLELRLPDSKPGARPPAIVCKVVRVEILANGNYEVGVSFSGLSEDKKAALFNCLAGSYIRGKL